MTILAVTTLLCAVANGAIAVADLFRAPFVLANSAEVGVATRWIPYLAGLKLAGALGLVLGFVAAPWFGLAAALGLVGFFVGAVGVHVHTRVFHNIAFPAVFLLLATGSTLYFADAVV
ncbi:DoxX family protein [Mycobacterium sp. smrl_JER01]|uniref:DoxX family protein n=1 Tax=Mycobacterium sp. smrl_JER01 TaxID=3402633 RepID=UPI003AD17217